MRESKKHSVQYANKLGSKRHSFDNDEPFNMKMNDLQKKNSSQSRRKNQFGKARGSSCTFLPRRRCISDRQTLICHGLSNHLIWVTPLRTKGGLNHVSHVEEMMHFLPVSSCLANVDAVHEQQLNRVLRRQDKKGSFKGLIREGSVSNTNEITRSLATGVADPPTHVDDATEQEHHPTVLVYAHFPVP